MRARTWRCTLRHMRTSSPSNLSGARSCILNSSICTFASVDGQSGSSRYRCSASRPRISTNSGYESAVGSPSDISPMLASLKMWMRSGRESRSGMKRKSTENLRNMRMDICVWLSRTSAHDLVPTFAGSSIIAYRVKMDSSGTLLSLKNCSTSGCRNNSANVAVSSSCPVFSTSLTNVALVLSFSYSGSTWFVIISRSATPALVASGYCRCASLAHAAVNSWYSSRGPLCSMAVPVWPFSKCLCVADRIWLNTMSTSACVSIALSRTPASRTNLKNLELERKSTLPRSAKEQ
mmetsp:Transcript_2945/g.10520  ORF Transcript_2945/g.10520 Transcript_2945/m.10520 type:complete len:292 (+) Transcript_2945:179-1054(+)